MARPRAGPPVQLAEAMAQAAQQRGADVMLRPGQEGSQHSRPWESYAEAPNPRSLEQFLTHLAPMLRSRT